MLSPSRHPLAAAALLVLGVFAGGALAPAVALASADPPPVERANVLGGVRSFGEFKWDSIVRQKLEVGCGAASLATIMTYYFGFPTTEQEMADAMLAEASAMKQGEVVRQIGFSMVHIKRVAARGGLIAQGFRVPIEYLDRIKIPVIARVTIRGYDHFLVFKGARDGRIFVADPAFGNGSYRLAAFEKIWSGMMIGFVRRGEVPTEHALLIEEQDDLAEVWDRITTRHLRSVADPRVLGAAAFSLSLMPPIINTLVPGLQSVFPTVLETRRPF